MPSITAAEAVRMQRASRPPPVLGRVVEDRRVGLYDSAIVVVAVAVVGMVLLA